MGEPGYQSYPSNKPCTYLSYQIIFQVHEDDFLKKCTVGGPGNQRSL